MIIKSSTRTYKELSSPIFRSLPVCELGISKTWPDLHFLAVQDSSIGDLVTDWVSEWHTLISEHYRDNDNDNDNQRLQSTTITTVTLQWHYSELELYASRC